MTAESRLAIATQGFRGGSGGGGDTVAADVTATIETTVMTATISETSISAVISIEGPSATLEMESIPATIEDQNATGDVTCP